MNKTMLRRYQKALNYAMRELSRNVMPEEIIEIEETVKGILQNE